MTKILFLPQGEMVSSEIFKPKGGVLDTLGAGDTFVAATIFARVVSSQTLEESIKFGCKVAGAKCGAHGFQHLHGFNNYL